MKKILLAGIGCVAVVLISAISIHGCSKDKESVTDTLAVMENIAEGAGVDTDISSEELEAVLERVQIPVSEDVGASEETEVVEEADEYYG